MTIKTVKELQQGEGSEKISLVGATQDTQPDLVLKDGPDHVVVTLKGQQNPEQRAQALRMARVKAPLLREQASQNIATLREINRAFGRKRAAR